MTVVAVYISLESTNVTTNNTEILITNIGEEDIYGYGGLPSLVCHTDLIECCRNIDTGGQGVRGFWYYPDGKMVQVNASSQAAGENFYLVRKLPPKALHLLADEQKTQLSQLVHTVV